MDNVNSCLKVANENRWNWKTLIPQLCGWAFSCWTYSIKDRPPMIRRSVFGTPGGIRTHGLLLRRQSLYPTELRVQEQRDYMIFRAFCQSWRSNGMPVFTVFTRGFTCRATWLLITRSSTSCWAIGSATGLSYWKSPKKIRKSRQFHIITPLFCLRFLLIIAFFDHGFSQGLDFTMFSKNRLLQNAANHYYFTHLGLKITNRDFRSADFLVVLATFLSTFFILWPSLYVCKSKHSATVSKLRQIVSLNRVFLSATTDERLFSTLFYYFSWK